MSEQDIVWTPWDDATPVSEELRDEWAEAAVNSIRDCNPVCDIGSGDSVVIALRHHDGITIYDCKLRREGHVREEL